MNWPGERVHVCYKSSGGGGARIITDDMRAAAEVATKQWNDYQSRFVPFEKKFIADMVGRDDTEKLQGIVGADIAQKVRAPKDPRTAGLPSSGAVDQAITGGLTDARAGALDRKAKGMDTVVAMGRGQQTEALNGLTEQAITSGQVASSRAATATRAATAERGQTFGLIGSGLGVVGAVGSNMNRPPVNAPGARVDRTYGEFGSPEVGVEYINPYYSGGTP